MKNPLGIQSYCLREFRDNPKAAALVRECGLAAIEIWRGHVDFQKPEGFAPALKAYRDGGVKIISSGVNLITSSEKEARNLFEFSKAAGTVVMSVDFKLEGLDEALGVAERLSEEYGVKLAVHNHGGRHWLGSRETLRWLFGRTSKRIGLNLDTGWAIDAREDPIVMAEEFAERLRIVHLKDFTYKPDRTPQDVIVGTGLVDLSKLKAMLEKIGFDGLTIIEYEGDAKNPVPSLCKCIETVRAGLGGIFS
jgi:inosose dehydratase